MIRILLTAAVAIPFAVAQVPASYTISTVAGTGTSGFAGDGGAPTSAQVAGVARMAIDSSGKIYFADQFNHRIRQFTVDGTLNTVAGSGTAGYKGDGSGATSAQLQDPSGVAVDSSGNIYIADTFNEVVRKVSGGNISTIAGVNATGSGYSGDGAAATSALLFNPGDIAVDSSGNVYIADTANNVVRKIVSGNISTYAGTGTSGSAGDNGAASSARLNSPTGIALDAAGNLYIADTGNHRIRKVTPTGIISTVAGTGTGGFYGDGGVATLAQLYRPADIAVDSSGIIYIADAVNSRIRRVTPDGIITTIAGSNRIGYSGDGGPATSATLNVPTGIAVDASGNVYFSDTQNNVIRMLKPVAGQVVPKPAIRSGGVATASAFGGSTTIAPGTWIEIFGTNLASTTRQWTSKDFSGSNAPTVLDGTSVTVGGQSAFVSYISPTQVNVQVPSGVATGTQTVVVTTPGGPSIPYSISVAASNPALLAPASFLINGKQYAVALLPDGSYVLPVNAIPGVASRPAKPGETVVLYGIGFGSTNPSVSAGQVTSGTNNLVLPMQLLFNQSAATLSYAGLTPGQVGLYQFNAVIPSTPAGDAVPVSFSLGGTLSPQTVYLAVSN